ncbi:MAG: FAD:protein FMN transferase [Bacteroidota bacterium]
MIKHTRMTVTASLKHLLWCFLLLPAMLRSQDLQRFEFSHRQMGTQFQLIFYAADSSRAQGVATAAFAKLDSLNHILSDYQSDSELNQLVAAAGSGRWVSVSDDLWQVISQSQQYASISNGAFDISVGAVSRRWRRALRRQEFPGGAAWDLAKANIDFRQIH